MGDNPQRSWGGSIEGRTYPAVPGVYTDFIRVTYFDGSKEVFSGDVNLIR
jgi:hypothetical protein